MDTLSTASLIHRRETLGLTREAFAAEASVDGATLWRIETGERQGTVVTWRRMLEALNRLEAERA